MNKKTLRHMLHFLRRINGYVLLFICVVCAFTAVFALRNNNQHMIVLRNNVFAADKDGGDIEGTLTTLRKYVYTHMNTNLSSGQNTVKPPIQLKYQYDRLMAASKAKFDTESAQVLTDATNTCTAQFPGAAVNIPRYNCAQAYAAAHPIKQQMISEDLYKFDFVSPSWSPDLAGWSIIVGCLSFVLFVLRYASEWFIKRELDSNS